MCGACGKKYSSPRSPNRSSGQALMQHPARQLSSSRSAPVSQPQPAQTPTVRAVTRLNANIPKSQLLKPPV